jgi:hypothetical protein
MSSTVPKLSRVCPSIHRLLCQRKLQRTTDINESLIKSTSKVKEAMESRGRPLSYIKSHNVNLQEDA